MTTTEIVALARERLAELDRVIAAFQSEAEMLRAMCEVARDVPEPSGDEPVTERFERTPAPKTAKLPAASPPRRKPPPTTMGRDGLPPNVMRVLEALRAFPDGASSGEIATRAGVDSAGTKRALERLRGRGLAEHNGQRSRGSRWKATGGQGVPDAERGPNGKAAKPLNGGLDGSVEQRARLVLRYAKVAYTTGAIKSRARAFDSHDGRRVEEELARLEADGIVVLTDDRWQVTAQGHEQLAAVA